MSGGQAGQIGQQQQLPPSGYGRKHLGPWATADERRFGINPPPEGLDPSPFPGERPGGPGMPPWSGSPMPIVTQPPYGPPPEYTPPPGYVPSPRPYPGSGPPTEFGINPPGPEHGGLTGQMSERQGGPNNMPLGAPTPDYYNGPQADPTMEMLRRRNMGGGLLSGGQQSGAPGMVQGPWDGFRGDTSRVRG